MPFVAVPNVMMVEMRTLIAAQNCENRIMVDSLTGVTPALLESTAILAWNWWQTHLAPSLGATTNLREVVATDLTVINGDQFTYAPSTGVVGSKTPSHPNEVAFCVSLRSGFRGRSARGRFFCGSLGASDMANANELTAGYASDLVLALNNLRTQLEAANTPLIIVSYRSGGVPRPGGPVKFLVANCLAVDNVVDSMRRRKPGVGS